MLYLIRKQCTSYSFDAASGFADKGCSLRFTAAGVGIVLSTVKFVIIVYIHHNRL